MVSWVWTYFNKISKDRAQCRDPKCNKTLSCAGSTTTGLAFHLNKIHGIFEVGVQQRPQVSQASGSVQIVGESSSAQTQGGQQQPRAVVKRQRTILECVSFPSFAETIARLAAESGISIQKIAKTSFIRMSLKKESVCR